MTTLNSPHDRFFKAVFGRTEVAAEFLERYLPAEVAATVDWATLRPEKETFLDPQLTQHPADLLYDNEDLAAKMRLMKNFGFSGYDNVIYPGTNGKMTEMAAAMGLVNLDAIDEFVAVNRRNHAVYARRLNALEGLSVLAYRLVRCYPNIPGHGDSPQRYAVRTLH
jgi:hypothetical protein